MPPYLGLSEDGAVVEVGGWVVDDGPAVVVLTGADVVVFAAGELHALRIRAAKRTPLNIRITLLLLNSPSHVNHVKHGLV